MKEWVSGVGRRFTFFLYYLDFILSCAFFFQHVKIKIKKKNRGLWKTKMKKPSVNKNFHYLIFKGSAILWYTSNKQIIVFPTWRHYRFMLRYLSHHTNSSTQMAGNNSICNNRSRALHLEGTEECWEQVRMGSLTAGCRRGKVGKQCRNTNNFGCLFIQLTNKHFLCASSQKMKDGPRKCIFVPLECFAVASTKQSWWSSSLDLWSRLVLSGSMERAFRFLTKASEMQ